MALIPTASLGGRGVEVTRIGFGCAPLGNLYEPLDDDQAIATVAAAWDAGIRFFDTAPLYGHGLAETRLGAALQGYPRDAFVVSSKVGRLLRPDPDCDPGIFRVPRGLAPQFNYSRDGVLRSIEDSLIRLGLDRLDVVLVHDPDDHEAEALEGAFPALVELRDQGVVRAIGSGMNQNEMLARFVSRVDLDCVLVAGRYTLLDRSGAGLLDDCAARGIGVIVGGVFNSGILARVDGDATFDYERGVRRDACGGPRRSVGPARRTGSPCRPPRSTSPCRTRPSARSSSAPAAPVRSGTTSPGPGRRSRSRCATSSTPDEARVGEVRGTRA